ncbi:reverse transcriptase domain-containing protein [Tanacetum coccineum]
MNKFVEILETLTAPVQGEILMMYLTASIESISAALFAKREEEQVPIYFVSRVLQGAELNYPRLEKLILALVHAVRRIQRTNANSFRFKTTNNEAEYEALFVRLRISQEMEITSLAIFVDS